MFIKFLHRNDFEKDEDLIIELLEADKTFLQERKSDYSSLKKTLKPNIFMSIKQQYINFAHLIAKNAIVATVITLIALTTVGASATELLAPEEFKPSTQIQNLFASNQQKDTNPYTALKPDENNDVVISDTCDLAIKYPKAMDNNPISIFRGSDVGTSYRSAKDESINYLEDLVIDITPKEYPTEGDLMTAYVKNPEEVNQFQEEFSAKYPGKIYIKCFDLKDFKTKDPYLKTEEQKFSLGKVEAFADFDTGQISTTEQINLKKDDLRNLTGWFLTEADIKGLVELQGKSIQTGASNIPEDLSNKLSNSSQKLRFVFGNKVYEIDFLSPVGDNSEIKGLFANQVQIQFNSLVKNKANKEIVKISDSANNNNTQNENSKTRPKESIKNKEFTVIGFYGSDAVQLNSNPKNPSFVSASFRTNQLSSKLNLTNEDKLIITADCEYITNFGNGADECIITKIYKIEKI